MDGFWAFSLCDAHCLYDRNEEAWLLEVIRLADPDKCFEERVRSFPWRTTVASRGTGADTELLLNETAAKVTRALAERRRAKTRQYQGMVRLVVFFIAVGIAGVVLFDMLLTAKAVSPSPMTTRYITCIWVLCLTSSQLAGSTMPSDEFSLDNFSDAHPRIRRAAFLGFTIYFAKTLVWARSFSLLDCFSFGTVALGWIVCGIWHDLQHCCRWKPPMFSSLCVYLGFCGSLLTEGTFLLSTGFCHFNGPAVQQGPQGNNDTTTSSCKPLYFVNSTADPRQGLSFTIAPCSNLVGIVCILVTFMLRRYQFEVTGGIRGASPTKNVYRW
jgi:hypothetical protein